MNTLYYTGWHEETRTLFVVKGEETKRSAKRAVKLLRTKNVGELLFWGVPPEDNDVIPMVYYPTVQHFTYLED